MLSLLDSDIYAYRAAAACENEDETMAKKAVDSLIIDTLMCGVDNVIGYSDSWRLHLTGKNNYRYDVATSFPYKGNRVDKEKPRHLSVVRQHLVDQWGAVISDGQEADDAVAIDATTHFDQCIIVSLDKDLDQVAGWHYNFIKREGYYITPEQGLFKFYCQILTGDTADNIVGLKGIGPVKAKKMLEDAEDEATMYHRCVMAYDGNEDRVIENARLLWLRRTKDEPLWTPPSTQTMSL